MTTVEDTLNHENRDRFWSHWDEDEPYLPDVTPISMWNPEFPPKKEYIRFGEECPICYEPIFSKHNATKTECGHVFHASCLTNFFCKCHDCTTYKCPMCRSEIKESITESKSVFYNSKNAFDELEDFWRLYDRKMLVPSWKTLNTTFETLCRYGRKYVR